MSLSECRLIDLPKINDPRGNLTVVEADRDIPFSIRRVYYLYDVPNGSGRGGHAHKELEQLFIAMSGEFSITLRDGVEEKTFVLANPHQGLYVSPMIWRDLHDFSPGGVCVVLASLHYDETDYFREWADFAAAVEQVQ